MTYLTPLSADEQRAEGITSPQPFAMRDRARFSELDPLNHVNNKAYLGWFETARIMYINALGLRDGTYGPAPRVVLRQAEINFLGEIKMDDDYIVTCRTARVGTTSATIWQEVWCKGKLCTTFSTVMVLIQPDGSGKMPVPEGLKKVLIERDGAEG